MIHKLIGDHILIEVIDNERKTEGGLYVKGHGFANATTGLVLLVGGGPLDSDGKHIQIPCRQEDMILYRNYASMDPRTREVAPDSQVVEWNEGDRKFRIIPGHYLIAVLEEETVEMAPTVIETEAGPSNEVLTEGGFRSIVKEIEPETEEQ